MKGLAKYLTLGIITSAMTGCFLSPVDSDNSDQIISAESLGKLAVESFSQTDSLSGTLLVADDASGRMTSDQSALFFGAAARSKQALGKVRAGEPLSFDVSDTANGVARIMYESTSLLATTYDTIVIKWDAVAKDDSIDDKNVISFSEYKVYKVGRVEYARVTDLDNDGVVSAAAGSDYNGSARFLFGAKTVSGEIEETVMDMGAGADLDFDGEEDDNPILAMSWKKLTAAGDTLGYAAFVDADGDGVLTDPAATTVSTVDINLYERNNPWKPFVEYSRLAMRVVTDGNEENDLITKLGGEEGLVTGRVNTVSVVDAQGDEIVTANEIATAAFETKSTPADDPVRQSQLEMVFDVGSGLQNEADNLFYEVHFNQEKKVGWVRSRTFDFTTSKPFADGADPTSGHLQFSAGYSNGKTAFVVADFDENGFSGTYTDPDGAVFSVVWSADGAVVSSVEN